MYLQDIDGGAENKFFSDDRMRLERDPEKKDYQRRFGDRMRGRTCSIIAFHES
jgi:hypothetical protein